MNIWDWFDKFNIEFKEYVSYEYIDYYVDGDREVEPEPVFVYEYQNGELYISYEDVWWDKFHVQVLYKDGKLYGRGSRKYSKLLLSFIEYYQSGEWKK